MNDDEPLFTAVYEGDPVTVSHATADEIDLIAGRVGPPEDLLEFWSLLTFRIGVAVEIHALGWSLVNANALVTAPLLSVSISTDAVRSRSGKAYLLGVRGHRELPVELRLHLIFALKTWGFTDIRLFA